MNTVYIIYLVEQELTGVRVKYRSRGVGKRLKAQMLFVIKENYPTVEYMTTGNAVNNEDILSINKGMGYKVTNVFHLNRYPIDK